MLSQEPIHINNIDKQNNECTYPKLIAISFMRYTTFALHNTYIFFSDVMQLSATSATYYYMNPATHEVEQSRDE